MAVRVVRWPGMPARTLVWIVGTLDRLVVGTLDRLVLVGILVCPLHIHSNLQLFIVPFCAIAMLFVHGRKYLGIKKWKDTDMTWSFPRVYPETNKERRRLILKFVSLGFT